MEFALGAAVVFAGVLTARMLVVRLNLLTATQFFCQAPAAPMKIALAGKATDVHGRFRVADLRADTMLRRRNLNRRSRVGLFDIPRMCDGNATINLTTLVSTSPFLNFRDVTAALATPAACLLPRLYRGVVWDPRDGTATWRGVDQPIAKIEDSHQKKLKLTRRLLEAGAPLLVGTDVGQPFVPPGLGVHIEMREFAAASVPIEDVWAIATWKAADGPGRPDLGRIRAGGRAFLIMFREDPTLTLGLVRARTIPELMHSLLFH